MDDSHWIKYDGYFYFKIIYYLYLFIIIFQKGDFKENQKHGYGQLFLANNERFSGQFFNNSIHG